MDRRVFAVGAALAAAVLALAPADASACSCVPPSLRASYHYGSDTIAARVLEVRPGEQRLHYRVEVIRAFSGCLQPGDRVTIETMRWSASCGQPLAIGARYLLTADAADYHHDPNVYSINLCGYNRPLADLTHDDREFLRSRSVYCEETGQVTCVDGGEPVQCIADPCAVETCPDAQTCESNYCGGCEAEFYTERWAPVCESPAGA